MNQFIFDKIRREHIDGYRPNMPIIIRVYVEGTWFNVPIDREELGELVTRAEKYQKRQEEKAREVREERLRKQREEQARRARESHTGTQGGTYTFWSANGSIFDEFFKNFRDMPQPGDTFNFTLPTEHQPKVVSPPRVRLQEIAGCVGVEITDKRLLRLAQRAAHPDTGGSHELWIEVEKLAKYLRL